MKSGLSGDVEKELKQIEARVPAADYEAFREPGRFEAFAESLAESMRQGTKGAAWDMRLYGREFDFKLEEVRAPITLFHGEADMNVPIALARRGPRIFAGRGSSRPARRPSVDTLQSHRRDCGSGEGVT